MDNPKTKEALAKELLDAPIVLNDPALATLKALIEDITQRLPSVASMLSDEVHIEPSFRDALLVATAEFYMTYMPDGFCRQENRDSFTNALDAAEQMAKDMGEESDRARLEDVRHFWHRKLPSVEDFLAAANPEIQRIEAQQLMDAFDQKVGVQPLPREEEDEITPATLKELKASLPTAVKVIGDVAAGRPVSALELERLIYILGDLHESMNDAVVDPDALQEARDQMIEFILDQHGTEVLESLGGELDAFTPASSQLYEETIEKIRKLAQINGLNLRPLERD